MGSRIVPDNALLLARTTITMKGLDMYESCVRCGWKDGIHDCRALTYQHPWLVINRATGTAQGCWSREEARKVWAESKVEVESAEPNEQQNYRP